jgi:hypothetical protein
MHDIFCSSTNHKDDYILETTDMPDELVREVGGTIVFEDVQMQVYTLNGPVFNLDKIIHHFSENVKIYTCTDRIAKCTDHVQTSRMYQLILVCSCRMYRIYVLAVTIVKKSTLIYMLLYAL